MDYLTGWHSGGSIGSEKKALSMDYLDRLVWKEPVDYLAIVRHQHGRCQSVQVHALGAQHEGEVCRHEPW